MTDLNWRQYGMCTAYAPDVMYPAGTDLNGIEIAKAVCRACQVRAVCLEDAMASEKGTVKSDRFGIRGALTGIERYQLQTRRRPSRGKLPKERSGGRKPAACGTSAAYDRHRRNGEPIDDACRAAHNDKNSAHRAKQREARVAG